MFPGHQPEKEKKQGEAPHGLFVCQELPGRGANALAPGRAGEARALLLAATLGGQARRPRAEPPRRAGAACKPYTWSVRILPDLALVCVFCQCFARGCCVSLAAGLRLGISLVCFKPCGLSQCDALTLPEIIGFNLCSAHILLGFGVGCLACFD